MKKAAKKKIAAGIAAAMAAAAFGGAYFVLSDAAANSSARWYAPEQARAGKSLFAAHCASCHGAAGVGSANWQRRGADGAYPPPPLNGTAHTWHHNLTALRRTIAKGGAPYGGKMPAFGGELTDEEQDALIAYIQSLWSDKIYAIWTEKVQGGR